MRRLCARRRPGVSSNGRLREPAGRSARADDGRGERLRRFLTQEAWPQISAEVLGSAPTKAEREAILGYGPEGC